jgi:ABC-type sugar transport system ATPase subunit
MIHVTHDQEEAMTLGDRIAVLRDGAAEQVAPPLQMYQRPVNTFVATFVGSPKMNLLEVTVTARSNGLTIGGSGFSIESEMEALPVSIDQHVPLLLGIRARDVDVVQQGQGDAAAQITLIEPLGHEAIVRARITSGPDITVVVDADAVPGSGDTVGVKFRRDRLHLFRADDGRRVT